MTLTNYDDLAWVTCNGRAIFLDIARDRYFGLPPEQSERFLAIAGAADTGEIWHQPRQFERPAKWVQPRASFDRQDRAKFSLSGAAAAVWLQRRVERRLASRGLERVLSELVTVISKSRIQERASSGLRPVVEHFEQARLLRTAADRCLPRSIALVTKLASRGVRAHLVLGVRIDPFGAHSWAQHEGVVLNDTLEEALRYEPILVL